MRLSTFPPLSLLSCNCWYYSIIAIANTNSLANIVNIKHNINMSYLQMEVSVLYNYIPQIKCIIKSLSPSLRTPPLSLSTLPLQIFCVSVIARTISGLVSHFHSSRYSWDLELITVRLIIYCLHSYKSILHNMKFRSFCRSYSFTVALWRVSCCAAVAITLRY